MQELFLLQNQDKLFLSKQNEWVDGRDLTIIYKTSHRDEALNQLFETNTKDYGQRIHIISCTANDKKLPEIDPEILPPPIPKKPKELEDSDNPQLDLTAADNSNQLEAFDDKIETGLREENNDTTQDDTPNETIKENKENVDADNF